MKYTTCVKCKGTGTRKDKKFSPCPKCNGKGAYKVRGNGYANQSGPCDLDTSGVQFITSPHIYGPGGGGGGYISTTVSTTFYDSVDSPQVEEVASNELTINDISHAVRTLDHADEL